MGKPTNSKKKVTAKSALKRVKIDLDALADKAITSIKGTAYQMYLRSKLKGKK